MKKICGLIVVAILYFTGCGEKKEILTGEQGGKLVVGTTDFPSEISPLAPSVFGSNDILDLLFMHLHRIDPATGKMKPELASSWEFSEDLTSITYYLRTDVKWSDGQPVTAEDVLYTYEKMADPASGYPDVARIRFIAKAEAVATNAIKFTFDRVYADLLMDSDIMPVPKHVYEKAGGNFGKNPVGNGPYRIKEFKPGSTLILVANAEYYRGKPPLDEIQLVSYASADTMAHVFAGGGLDLILDITPATAKRLLANKNVSVDSRPGNSYTYVGWNLTDAFLKDKDTRRALTMAINRTRILDVVFAGMGKLSLGPLPPSSWGYNEAVAPIEYNPGKARDLLRQKGFTDRNGNGVVEKDGREFALTIITNVENPDRIAILNNVAEDLKAIGIRVNSRSLDAGSFILSLAQRNFDGFIMGWTVLDKIDPTVYWNSDPVRGKYNFSSYKNSRIDSLIEIGATMLDRKKARAIWGEFQKQVYEDQPYTFLVVPNNISAGYQRVKGADDGIQLARAYNYWIPEAERRVAVAVVVPPVKEEVAVVVPEKKTEKEKEAEKKIEEIKPKITMVTAPEKLLEAAVKKETTTVATTTITAPPVEPPKPVVIVPPKPTKRVMPRYPAAAKSVGAAGKIVVRVVVGVDGKVVGATILSSFGNPACEEEALAAARQWEFDPATKNGEPFEQKMSIPFDFKP